MSFMLAKLVWKRTPLTSNSSADKGNSCSEPQKKRRSCVESVSEDLDMNPESVDPNVAYVFGIMDLSSCFTQRKSELLLTRNKAKHGEHDVVKPKYKVFAAEKYTDAVLAHFECKKPETVEGNIEK